VIPPRANAEFVACLEDVLEVYTRPDDEKHPLVCLDETTKQRVGETQAPMPLAPGRAERYDYEYVRPGVANLFLLFEPLQGERHVKVTDPRTRADWAGLRRELVDVHYPQAETLTVVLDNLNTHSLASLYETFEPQEARRIARKLALPHTPKHGSGLNRAEIELSVLSRQCLDRRIADKEGLQCEVAAWEQQRNRAGTTVDWRFTTDDARIKLKRLYPSIQL
jgi:hypothetical protein